MPGTPQPDARLLMALVRSGLIVSPEEAMFEAFAGGVSSDIWKVATPWRIFCVKRVLPKLKVGSFARSERMAKRNEGLRLAEALGQGRCLAPRASFPWGRSCMSRNLLY